MGCGRQQDQRFRTRGQAFGQPRPLALLGPLGPLRYVLALIDHDDVPIGVIQVVAVFAVVLQRVHRDDGLVVVVKRVLVGGDLLPDALDANRIEPHQGDGETRPELLLELHQHALGGHHQDAPAAAAADQLAAKDAAFQRLAQTHRIGDQQPLPRHRQRLGRRHLLIRQWVHRRQWPHHQVLSVGTVRRRWASIKSRLSR